MICSKLILLFEILLVVGLTQSTGERCKSQYETNSKLTGECKDVDMCVGAAIASTTCVPQNQICCVPEPDEAPLETPNEIISKEQFLNISGNNVRNNALYRYFTDSLALANIKTEFQVAAYLAQLIDETDYFRKIESVTMETDINPELGNIQKGDGVTFRGRGGILLRGRKNYNLANNDTKSQLLINSGKQTF